MASAVVGALRVLLEANASQLESEFGKATLKVDAFDKHVTNAGRTMQRMLDSFSGHKLVAEATAMANAIEKVGGVSKLTDAELKRVSSTITEATSKLKAMGVNVPESIAKLNGELGKLNTNTTTLGTTAVPAATSAIGGLTRALQVFGVGISVAAVVQFGKQLLADADAAQKLSDKTGIAVEAVQRLKYAAEQSGNTIDQVTSAVTQMQNRLAEGDKSAVGALRQLGLSLDTLMSMTPDRQFTEIARAIGEIEDPMQRTRHAMDLFGKSGAEILPTLRADIKKLGDEAPVMSEKAVAAFDAIGDAIDRNWTRAKNATGEGIAAAIDGYTRLFDISRALMTGDFARVPEVLFDLASELPKVGEPVNAMLKGVAENGKGVALSMDEIDKASKDLDSSFKKNAKAAEDYAKALDKAAKEQRDFNNWIGERYIEAERQRLEAAEKSERQLRDYYNWLGQRRMEDDAALMKSTGILYNYQQAFIPLKAAAQSALRPIETADSTNKRLAQSSQEATTSLRNLAQSFANLAQIAGDGGLSKFVRGIGEIIGSIALGRDAIAQFRSGLDSVQAGKFTAGLAQMATGLTAFVGAAIQASNTTSKLRGTLQGAASGFMSGGIWGAIGGAIIGYANSSAKAAEAQRQLWTAMQKTRIALVEQFNDLGNARFAFKALHDEFQRLMHTPATEDTLERMQKIIQEIQKNIDSTNESFSDLANEMIQAGYKIPAALQPALQRMADLGVLSKENLALFAQLTDGTVVDWQKMQEAGQRYGDWMSTELGRNFNQLKNNDFAKQIINDFDLLTRGGAEVGSVLFGMKEEIIQLIKDSIKFGTTIPENMRPWIEELERSGNLIDENGEYLYDLGALKFGPPIETQFEQITKAIEKLIDTLDRLAGALTSLPSVDVKVPSGTAQPGDFPEPGYTHMARGGIVTRPMRALIGEAGPEAIIPLSRRYAPPMMVPLPNLNPSLPTAPDFTKVPDKGGELERVLDEWRGDFREMFETFKETMLLGIRDAALGAV